MVYLKRRWSKKRKEGGMMEDGKEGWQREKGRLGIRNKERKNGKTSIWNIIGELVNQS